MKRMKKNQGYTLIEMVTVGLILVIITTVIASILTSSLRGTNKSRVTSEVAQNGNYALSVISNIFITSKIIESVDGEPIVDCAENPSGESVVLTRNDGGSTTLLCNFDNDPPTVSSNGASLIDNSRVELSSESSCFFTCKQNGNSYSAPLLEVGFTLKQKGSSNFSDTSSSQDFTTQILMRNFFQD